jgi:hypothetical protein
MSKSLHPNAHRDPPVTVDADLRLIEPSHNYPVIEVEVVLNFFPGDHVTAERYKAFVQTLTKVRL